VRESVKHRFIGAAVLAAMAVLFLPGFFKDKQAYEVDTNSHIPTRPSITAVDFDEPERGEDPEPAPTPDAMFLPREADALPMASDVDEPATLAGSPVASATATSSSLNDVAAMPLNEQGLPDAWVIQVASLGTLEAATKLRDQLQKDGYKAYLRSVSGQNTHRVFIGPKLDKSKALELKAELDKRLKVNSLVLPFKP
jgi:DedD protein